MKTIIFFALLWAAAPAKGQDTIREFAPIGAKWWYNGWWTSEQGYVNFESVRDTLVEGRRCKIIRERNYMHVPEGVREFVCENHVVCQEGSVILYFNGEVFLKLFDFGMQVGDTVIMSKGDSYIQRMCVMAYTFDYYPWEQAITAGKNGFMVLSTDTVRYPDVTIIKYLGYNLGYGYSYLIAPIGPYLYLFGDGGGVIESEPQILVCYQDSHFTYMNDGTVRPFDGSECFTFPPGSVARPPATNHIQSGYRFNPVQNDITIEENLDRIVVASANGTVTADISRPLPGTKINLEFTPSGIYFVKTLQSFTEYRTKIAVFR